MTLNGFDTTFETLEDAVDALREEAAFLDEPESNVFTLFETDPLPLAVFTMRDLEDAYVVSN